LEPDSEGTALSLMLTFFSTIPVRDYALTDWFLPIFQTDFSRDLLIALMMEAVRTSETLINSYRTTRRYKPEDSHFQ
jgi:hypothetical protein